MMHTFVDLRLYNLNINEPGNRFPFVSRAWSHRAHPFLIVFQQKQTSSDTSTGILEASPEILHRSIVMLKFECIISRQVTRI
jgi:hypothetical protein